MGDIATHRKVYEEFVRPRLTSLTDDEAIFVELGNFLTDISQFRDPFAHLSGKRTIWNKVRSERWGLRFLFFADLVADMDGYLDQLLGVPAGGDPNGRGRVPHGKLAAWFREILFAYAVEKSFRQKALPRPYLIDPPELRRLYDTHFTQYFPHEHLDFPPERGTGRLDNFTLSTVAAGDAAAGTRRIAAYVERHLEYVSDILTRVERDWAHAPANLSGADRHDALVRLGHAGHAVEDYFFHSNFTELAFASTGLPLPLFDPAETVDAHDPDGELVPGPTSSRWARIHHRRLQRPVLGSDGETFSASTSVPADLAFTALLGSEDIFHTILDALGFLAAEPAFDARQLIAQLNEACGSDHRLSGALAALATVGLDKAAEVPWAILHVLLFGDEKAKASALTAYNCLVTTGALESFMSGLATKGLIHRLAAEAVGRACTLERSMLSEYSLVGKGILGTLIELMGEAKDRSVASQARSVELDAINDGEVGGPPQTRMGYTPSDNGAGAERIGTHSLLSKDSVRKQPLRRQAINLAGFTLSYVAKTMAEQQSGVAPLPNVDWQQLLSHFACHPDQARDKWWQPVLEWDRTELTRPPEHHDLKFVDATTVASRAAETAKPDLEEWYNDLTSVAEDRYRSAVKTDWVVDSAINGAIIGGLVGGIAAGATNQKSVGGVFAAIGLGLVVGGAGTAGLAWLGATIDDRAGAVVGMLLGLTGSAVASGFLGHAVADV